MIREVPINQKSSKTKQEYIQNGKRLLFLEHGVNIFTDCELLKFMLHYSNSHQNASITARALIKRFGSFTTVIEADFNALLSVKGVDKCIANMIHQFRILSQVYLEKKTSEDLLEFFTVERLKSYCSSLFINAKDEELHCLCLTDDLKLISTAKICSGSGRNVNIPVRNIVRSVFANNCNRIVIAHNHPAGSCIPSTDDMTSTDRIYSILKQLDIELIDHVVVGRKGVTSMKESGFMSYY